MIIPTQKIQAVVVGILSIGIGIGVPLLGRMQTHETQANVIQEPQGGTSLPAENQNNLVALNSPGQPVIECSANPPGVYVGDQVVWAVKTSNIINPEQFSFTWSGAVTGTGSSTSSTYGMSGVYTATVQLNSVELGKRQTSCAVNVLEKPAQGGQQNQLPVQPQTSTALVSQANVSNGNVAVSDTGTSASSNQTTAADSNLPEDILTCTVINPTIIQNQNQISIMRCKLQMPAQVTARIIKGDYTPPAEPDAASIIKTLVSQKTVYDKVFSFNWNGIDSYDTPVPEGSYTFAVSAQQTATSPPDISIQKIQVIKAAPQPTQQIIATQETAASSQQSTSGPGDSGQNPTVAGDQPKTPEPSKCPGYNYPKDIEGNWAKDYIRAAYDDCVFQGYSDGTFRPALTITRGETVKVALVARGIPPKYGCFDADCGTPFTDLVPSLGKWVRAAWDLKIVKGVTESLFVPQRAITRGEAVVLIAKVFKVEPFKNCFTPNCGAGHPNNFFMDISDLVQGSYIRAMWDKGVIRGTGPETFEPDRIMTRAEMAAMLMKAQQILGKNK